MGYLQVAVEWMLFSLRVSANQAIWQSHTRAFESNRNLVNLGSPEKAPFGICRMLLL